MPADDGSFGVECFLFEDVDDVDCLASLAVELAVLVIDGLLDMLFDKAFLLKVTNEELSGLLMLESLIDAMDSN